MDRRVKTSWWSGIDREGRVESWGSEGKESLRAAEGENRKRMESTRSASRGGADWRRRGRWKKRDRGRSTEGRG